MEYKKAMILLKNNTFLNEGRNLQYSYNKIRLHNRFETENHFIAKAMLAFLLITKKHDAVLTEAEMRNGRCMDALSIKDSGGVVGYEVESDENDKCNVDGVDTIVIKLKDMPPKAREGIEELAKWLTEFMV